MIGTATQGLDAKQAFPVGIPTKLLLRWSRFCGQSVKLVPTRWIGTGMKTTRKRYSTDLAELAFGSRPRLRWKRSVVT